MKIELGQRVRFLEPESAVVLHGYVTRIDEESCIVCDDLRFINGEYAHIKWAYRLSPDCLLEDWYATNPLDPILDKGEQLSWITS